MKDIIESWNIHNRINLYLLDAIEEGHLGSVSSSKGRNVGEQFAHMHNVRLMWLKVAEPDLLKGIDKIEKDTITKKHLQAGLERSAKAISTLFEHAAKTNKIKSFKPHFAHTIFRTSYSIGV